MPNVSVDSWIVTFSDQPNEGEARPCALDPEYLHGREMAERAAAKKSGGGAARAVHQQLAQLYEQQRRQLSGGRR